MTEEFWIQTIRSAPTGWLEKTLGEAEEFLKEAKVIVPQILGAHAFLRTVADTEADVRLIRDELARRKSG